LLITGMIIRCQSVQVITSKQARAQLRKMPLGHESRKMVGVSSKRKLRLTLCINIVEAETEFFPLSHD
jgi:hypothetical protein